MKKKLMPIVLCVLLAVMLTAVFAACEMFANPSSKSTKTEDSIEIAVANDGLTIKDDAIILQEGGTTRLQKSDFTVKVVYDDGSKKKITDYTFDTEGIDYDRAGGYVALFTYKSFSASYSVVVESQTYETLPAIPQDEDLSVTYSGTKFYAVDLIDDQMTGIKLSDLIEAGSVRIDTSSSYTSEATNAGDYQIGLTAAGGYSWVENGNKITTVSVPWSIKKRVISIPTLREGAATEFIYDGTAKTLDIDTHNFDDVVTFMNGGDTHSATDVGTYTCQVMIKSDCQVNYAFLIDGQQSSGSVVDITTWSIAQKTIPMPAITGYQSSNTDEYDNVYYHYYYTGSLIELGLDYSAYPEIKVTGVDQVKNVNYLSNGNYDEYSFYTIILEAADDVVTNNATGNYKWEGATTLDPITFYVYVDPIEFAVPLAVSNATLQAQGQYGSVSGYDINLNYGEDSQWGVALVANTRTLLEENDMLTEGASIVYAGQDAGNVTVVSGTHSFAYTLNLANYEPVSLTIEVTIDPLQSAVTEVRWTPYVNYDIEENSATVTRVGEISGDHVYVGKGHFEQVYFELGYLPEGFQVTYKVYAGELVGEDIVYGENPIMTAVSEDCAYNTSYYYPENSISTAINAGYYKTVAEFGEYDNYVFTVNGNVVSGVEKEWTVGKSAVKIDYTTTGTYGEFTMLASDNTKHFSYYTGVEKTAVPTPGNVWVNKYNTYNYPHFLIFDLIDGSEINDYVEVLSVETFKYNADNQSWEPPLNTREVGLYKTVATAQVKEAYADNFELESNEWSIEWAILNNEIDLSGVTWNAKASYVFGEDRPQVTGLPDGVKAEYSGTGAYNGNVGTGYEITVAFEADQYADGWEGVTFTNVPAQLTKTFDITKKTITAADFYLTMDEEKTDTVEYEQGHYYSAKIATDIGIGGLNMLRSDEDGVGYPNYEEAGDYVLWAYVYLVYDNDTYGNFEFDETDTDNVFDASTEQLASPRGTELVVGTNVSTHYTYVLKVSFSFHIAAAE